MIPFHAVEKHFIEKMDSKALETVSELIGLPLGLQSTLALTLEENWNLGLFKDLLQNPNGSPRGAYTVI